MKRFLTLIVIAVVIACCNEPIQVTGRPNQQDATSGTLGSAKSTNQLPPADTIRKFPDTLRPGKN